MSYKKVFTVGEKIKAIDMQNNFSILQYTMNISNEDLTDQIITEYFYYGSAKTFEINYRYISGSIKVYVDGLRLRRNVDYVELSDTEFELVVGLMPGQEIVVDYVRADI